MFNPAVTNSNSFSEEGSVSFGSPVLMSTKHHAPDNQKTKKKRNLPGNPDPDAEVIALSSETLLAKNRFFCEICNKGFQRDQNLQLHRRGHNLPWKLKRKNDGEFKKKVYVCPERSCIHHQPTRALGDLTGIRKHYSRKHGEKKFQCEKCLKMYAVQSDWKAHSKICGIQCDQCGAIFPRKDSWVTHKTFCRAIAEESVRVLTNPNNIITTNANFHFNPQNTYLPSWVPSPPPPPPPLHPSPSYLMSPLPGYIHPLSSTSLLHRVAAGHMRSNAPMNPSAVSQRNDEFTCDLLGRYMGSGSGYGTETELNAIGRGGRRAPHM